MNTKIFATGIVIAGSMLLSLFFFPGEDIAWIITRAGVALLGAVFLIASFFWQDSRNAIRIMFLVIAIFTAISTFINGLWDWSIQKYPGAAIAAIVAILTALLVIAWITTPANLNKRRIAR